MGDNVNHVVTSLCFEIKKITTLTILLLNNIEPNKNKNV